MTIDWMSLLVVAGVTIAAAAAVVGIFSLGLAALTAGGREAGSRPNGAQRAGAYACFAAVVLIVLYGLYLIIPQFH